MWTSDREVVGSITARSGTAAQQLLASCSHPCASVIKHWDSPLPSPLLALMGAKSKTPINVCATRLPFAPFKIQLFPLGYYWNMGTSLCYWLPGVNSTGLTVAYFASSLCHHTIDLNWQCLLAHKQLLQRSLQTFSTIMYRHLFYSYLYLYAQ